MAKQWFPDSFTVTFQPSGWTKTFNSGWLVIAAVVEFVILGIAFGSN